MANSNAIDLKKWIQETLLSNNKAISKRLSQKWMDNNGFESQFKLLMDKTNFLPNDASIPQRMWHIINNHLNVYVCNNPSCNETPKFNTYNKGYLRTCSPPCAQLDPNTLQKIKSTNNTKYGVDYGLSNMDIRQQIKTTVKEKYGVNNVSCVESVKRKKEETCLNNYGTKYYLSNQIEKERIIQEKYGTDNVMKVDGVKNKMRSTKLLQNYHKLFNSDRFKDKVTPQFSLEEYKGVEGQEYTFKCNTCDSQFISKMEDGDIPRCYVCYPIKGTSLFEKEVYDYILSFSPNVESNNTEILGGKEVDVYDPINKIGVECNGLYWHSESNGRDRKYHLSKTNICEQKGIQLIHIFEDEWIYKQDIVKSKLKHIFARSSEKIYARNCNIQTVSKDDCDTFLETYHIQGKDNSKIRYGIYYNDELFGVMTFGACRVSLGGKNKSGEYELYRFCTKSHIIGSGGKLLSHFIKINSPTLIITYADRRWTKSSNNLYEQLGFKKESNGTPNYWYFKGGSKRYHRFGFTKHILHKKLENFDPNLTEWKNMQLHNYDRIWDCGHLKYIMSF